MRNLELQIAIELSDNTSSRLWGASLVLICAIFSVCLRKVGDVSRFLLVYFWDAVPSSCQAFDSIS